jgi:hypothetical protein
MPLTMDELQKVLVKYSTIQYLLVRVAKENENKNRFVIHPALLEH